MFSVVLPLAPLWALANNVMEKRTDAFKLCRNSRRPHPKTRHGIGAWSGVLAGLSYVAVMSNCALLYVRNTPNMDRLVSSVTSRAQVTSLDRLVAVLVLEHALYALKGLFGIMSTPHESEGDAAGSPHLGAPALQSPATARRGTHRGCSCPTATRPKSQRARV